MLYSLGANGSQDGNVPAGKLVFDQQGNLYGTTEGGGANANGTVFELSPLPGGGWAESVIHSFCSQLSCADGANPAAGVILDGLGNLYGTTSGGGNNGQVCCWGTVFELSPPSVPGGVWTESVLYTFGGNTTGDGCYPEDKLTFDAAGNLYGTASQCSGTRYAAGSVFKLTPSSNGPWSETVLYRFCANGLGSCPDGAGPKAGLTFDESGNLYGTSYGGGSSGGGGRGTVYELSPNANGEWTETVLHSFGLNGSGPLSSIDLDQAGNLYGTVSYGGLGYQNCLYDCGGIFRVTKVGEEWKMSLFQFNGLNGGDPAAGIFLISQRDTAFGTTRYGGTQGAGTVFELHGKTETALYTFCSQPGCADGSEPMAALISDKSGHLYGTTAKGGAYGQGVVFEITP